MTFSNSAYPASTGCQMSVAPGSPYQQTPPVLASWILLQFGLPSYPQKGQIYFQQKASMFLWPISHKTPCLPKHFLWKYTSTSGCQEAFSTADIHLSNPRNMTLIRVCLPSGWKQIWRVQCRFSEPGAGWLFHTVLFQFLLFFGCICS